MYYHLFFREYVGNAPVAANISHQRTVTNLVHYEFIRGYTAEIRLKRSKRMAGMAAGSPGDQKQRAIWLKVIKEAFDATTGIEGRFSSNQERAMCVSLFSQEMAKMLSLETAIVVYPNHQHIMLIDNTGEFIIHVYLFITAAHVYYTLFLNYYIFLLLFLRH